MKSIVMSRFGGAEELVAANAPDPPVARDGWVVVKVAAAALNWHDILVRRGQYRSPLPHTPGADGAGVRTDTGEEVVILPSLFWGGERTAAPGGPDFEILGDSTPVPTPSTSAFPRSVWRPNPPVTPGSRRPRSVWSGGSPPSVPCSPARDSRRGGSRYSSSEPAAVCRRWRRHCRTPRAPPPS